jgi:hypothetical protein
VTYRLPRAAPVRIAVLDLQGREVAVVADGNHRAGTHSISWNARRLAPGMYFVKLRTPELDRVRRIVVAR